MSSVYKHKLAIVICTYNRASLLEECLHSFLNQTAQFENFEVIIVDNNSSDNTYSISHKFVREYSNFRYVRELEQGLSYARNRGYKEAKTEWVAYVDDDAKAHQDFVERAIWVIENSKFDAIGGVYLQWYKYGKPKWYLERYGTNKFGKPNKLSLLEKGYCSGGVFLIKTSILHSIGGFPIDIGMKGTTVGYGEEVKLQKKLRQNGYQIGFDPKLKIDHLVASYKLSVFWFFKSYFASGRDSWYMYDKNIKWGYIIRDVLLLPFLLIKYFLRSVFKIYKRDFYWQNLVVDTFSPICLILGQIYGGLAHKLKAYCQ